MVGHLSSFFQKKRAAREENGDDCNSHGAALFSTMETKNEKKSAPKWPSRASVGQSLVAEVQKKVSGIFLERGEGPVRGLPRADATTLVRRRFFLRQGEEESTELSTTTSRPKRVKGEREKSLCFFFTLYFFLNFFSLSSGVPLSCLHSRETRVQSEALLCLIYTKLKKESGNETIMTMMVNRKRGRREERARRNSLSFFSLFFSRESNVNQVS